MRLERRKFLQVTAASLMSAATVKAKQTTSVANTPGWWMTEPIRWVQTNLRETDTALDEGHRYPRPGPQGPRPR